VLVDVPMDLFSRPLDPDLATRYPLPARVLGPALAPGAAEEIVERLARARRPLLFAGGGVTRSGPARWWPGWPSAWASRSPTR